MLTFPDFQATGRDVPDLSEIPEIAAQGIENTTPGRVYTDGLLYIERSADPLDPWHRLTIGNHQFVEPLAALEQRLYEFAVSEGYI
ncbi:MAG: hypothetical protein ACREV7_16615 [Steroidobacteraceae bacterium]